MPVVKSGPGRAGPLGGPRGRPKHGPLRASSRYEHGWDWVVPCSSWTKSPCFGPCLWPAATCSTLRAGEVEHTVSMLQSAASVAAVASTGIVSLASMARRVLPCALVLRMVIDHSERDLFARRWARRGPMWEGDVGACGVHIPNSPLNWGEANNTWHPGDTDSHLLYMRHLDIFSFFVNEVYNPCFIKMRGVFKIQPTVGPTVKHVCERQTRSLARLTIQDKRTKATKQQTNVLSSRRPQGVLKSMIRT